MRSAYSVDRKQVMVGESEGGTGSLYFRGDTVFQVYAESEGVTASALQALP